LTAAWDTTLVSRLYPGGALEGHLLDRAREGEPIAITAPTVMEVVRGLQGSAESKPAMGKTLDWLIRLISSGLVEVLSLDRPAAILAGRLRAMQPAPPTGARRKGTKPEQRASWVLDIQIAACAWTHGREVATENRADFEALSRLIARLHPDSPLAVASSPLG
jgi:predicted nucleic acid-binding protein